MEVDTVTFLARVFGVLVVVFAAIVWCNLQYYRLIVKPRMIREYEKKGYATRKGRLFKVYFTPAHIVGRSSLFCHKVDALYEFMPMTPREQTELQNKLAQ